MRDDYDDYDTGNNYGRSSAVSWLVMGAAALGFLGLGWYAFSSSESGGSDDEIVTLDAYEDPYKHAPEDKGGMEFPHQDKTIYDALDGNTRGGDAEALFPEPEEPVIPEIPEEKVTEPAAPEAGDGAESYVAEPPVNEAAEKVADAAPAAAPKVEEVPTPAPVVAEKKPEPAPMPVVVEKKPEPKPAPVVVEKKPEPAPVVKAPTPPAAPAKPVATGGSYAVQLGAFKSDAEAKTQWSKIVAKHGSILGGTKSVVVKADLPNGTFYRLRAVGFASEAAAKSACASLAKAGQGCFFAGK